MTKDEIIKALRDMAKYPTVTLPRDCEALKAAADLLAQPEQEPVAMKFKIYKPTVPDPMRQGINNALLPWVYDQDRNSGFDATMWVTPVATLPPQRKPLTNEEIRKTNHHMVEGAYDYSFKQGVKWAEYKHGIKGEA